MPNYPPIKSFSLSNLGLPYMTSATFSDLLTPTYTNQLILFLSSAFWGPPPPLEFEVIYGISLVKNSGLYLKPTHYSQPTVLRGRLPAAVLRGRGLPERRAVRGGRVRGRLQGRPGTNCIKIGLPGKLILSKRKGLREVQFS